jgi:hypothetical protein
MKRPTNRRPNPIAARVAPPVGQVLPTDWSQQAVNHGGTFDRRDLSQMWREPQWSAKTNSATAENIIQSARLSK